MRRECDDSGVDGNSGGNLKKQGRMDGCSPHQRGTNTPGGGGSGNSAGSGGPGGQQQMCPTGPNAGGNNLYLPPTPFQETLIAANPFDDSHMASAHLKGNLAKNFPPGKGNCPRNNSSCKA
ncbi:trihydrophobin-like [Varroa destructor]|uniref:Uncharacterized protein n=1 Tax=Varroa destructor TaxID=109461 RepID=A0A7M7KJC9_VARDE|nr:trihydrophobin-like [Varroa destructor]XP_022667841.1 trihydrophobin-like [Varroa destructor]XP_022667842.1 trihydrophobin-like [Varroa destructor]XP_022667843.1 trihydrophobin-like [Varroa destructor]XP_022667844.1 trihydrophobin-like [Varroa destructor]